MMLQSCLNIISFILLSAVLFPDFTRGESNKTRTQEGKVFAADGSTQKYEKSSQKIGLLHGCRCY
jgi:transposase